MGYKVRNTGADFELPSAGLHAAVCTHVVPLGLQEGFKGKVREMIALVFEIDEKREDGTPFQVSQRYTASTNTRATFRKHLDGWRSVPLTDQEVEEFDTERLVGAPAYVNIELNTKEDRTYTNISSILKLPPTVTPPQVTHQPVPKYLVQLAEKGRALAAQQEWDQSNTPLPASAAPDSDPNDDLPF